MNYKKQKHISDFMHWSEAVRKGILFCDECGAKIDTGCIVDSNNRNICCQCESKRYKKKELNK